MFWFYVLYCKEENKIRGWKDYEESNFVNNNREKNWSDKIVITLITIALVHKISNNTVDIFQYFTTLWFFEKQFLSDCSCYFFCNL